MGDSGPAYQVGTLFGYTDDLHYRGILQVVHTRDCTIAWGAWGTDIHSIRSRSQVYSSLLEWFPMGHGNTVDDEHYFSSPNEQSVRDDHPNVRGHTMGMHP